LLLVCGAGEGVLRAQGWRFTSLRGQAPSTFFGLRRQTLQARGHGAGQPALMI
jgi:hypothetical protein